MCLQTLAIARKICIGELTEMSNRKFQSNDRVLGPDKAPASFRGRSGVVVDFKGKGGYGVRFDDRPEIVEYVNSDWIVKEKAAQLG